mgnify:CR=1 FL=1
MSSWLRLVSEDLTKQWLQCMQGRSGAPDLEGRARDAEPFDSAVSACTFSVFKHTGKQVPESAFETAKKYWQPGYWSSHTPKPEESKVTVKLKRYVPSTGEN